MSDAHQTIGIERCRRDLPALHDLVIRGWGRIEIVCDTDDERGGSILLSKAELAHLERALEILCEMPGGKTACDELTRIAGQTTHRAPGADAYLNAIDSVNIPTGENPPA